jgi:hypothetical protein
MLGSRLAKLLNKWSGTRKLTHCGQPDPSPQTTGCRSPGREVSDCRSWTRPTPTPGTACQHGSWGRGPARDSDSAPDGIRAFAAPFPLDSSDPWSAAEFLRSRRVARGLSWLGFQRRRAFRAAGTDAPGGWAGGVAGLAPSSRGRRGGPSLVPKLDWVLGGGPAGP